MSPLRIALLAFGLVTLALPAGSAERTAAPGLPVLTKVRQILNLTHEQAARHYPVQVTGVVTYCHFPSRGPWSLFVQDDTGGVFVSGPGPHVAVGQRISVTGISDPGEFAPKIHRTAVEILGTAPLPVALRKPFEDLISGKEDCQWVEIDGIVRSARLRTPGGDELLLDLATGGGRIGVHVLLDANRDFAPLVDAEVSVRGVSATVLNRRQQLLAVEIYTHGLSQVSIEEPAPGDPYALPRSHIGNLLQFSRSGRFGHRVKVSGRVTSRDPNGSLYLRDDTGALLVQTREPAPVTIGDELEVLGFPAAGGFAPYLQDATFRRTATPNVPPVARPVTAAQLGDGRYEAELVALEAIVLESVRSLQQDTLTLQSGSVVFTAALKSPPPGGASVAAGSRVRVTGICAMGASADRSLPQSFHVLLRSPADVVILAQPSWWTLARVLRVLGVALVVIAIAFGWLVVLWRNNRLLREHRQVQQELLAISEREQCRIAQDLHDGVCQQLGAVGFLTRMLEEDLNAASPPHAQAAREISRHLSDAINQTRTVAKGLFPVKLEQNGLESALEELAAQTSSLFKVDCQFHTDRRARLDDNEAARNLYYVAYEAVNNALKHAQARHIRIELEHEATAIVLRVSNDGAQFSLGPAEQRGLGLHIMKYRAQAIGATFSIASNAAAGCTVTCILPREIKASVPDQTPA